MATKKLGLPIAPDFAAYCEMVFCRSNQLIDTGIWEGIDKNRLNDWIECFRNNSNDLLAALLLDNLIYRSKDQCLALIRHLFLEYTSTNYEDLKWASLVELLIAKSDPGIRLVPVIGQEFPPTKSGPYVLRLAQRIFKFNSKWLIWAEQISSIPSSVHTIFFVDDFCGTGTQFEKFLTKTLKIEEIRQQRPDLKFVYLVTAIHCKGMEKIQQLDSKVKIFCADYLDEKHDFFQKNHFSWLEQTNTQLLPNIVKDYQELCKKTNLPCNAKYELNLTYAFAHGTPNNTLCAYWYDSSSLWAPLLER